MVDIGTILVGIGGVLGGGGIVGGLQAYLRHRKSREESTDERAFRIIDELQAQINVEREHAEARARDHKSEIEKIEERMGRQRKDLGVHLEQIGLLQKQANKLEESRRRLIRRYRLVEKRHRQERAEDAEKHQFELSAAKQRIEILERELREALARVEDHDQLRLEHAALKAHVEQLQRAMADAGLAPPPLPKEER